MADILAEKGLDDGFAGLLDARKDYREALKIQEEADKAVRGENLSESQAKAVDRRILAVNHCGAVFGRAAYGQGLKDGMRLSAELKVQ